MSPIRGIDGNETETMNKMLIGLLNTLLNILLQCFLNMFHRFVERIPAVWRTRKLTSTEETVQENEYIRPLTIEGK